MQYEFNSYISHLSHRLTFDLNSDTSELEPRWEVAAVLATLSAFTTGAGSRLELRNWESANSFSMLRNSVECCSRDMIWCRRGRENLCTPSSRSLAYERSWDFIWSTTSKYSVVFGVFPWKRNLHGVQLQSRIYLEIIYENELMLLLYCLFHCII